MNVIITIPAYNEENDIEKTINDIRQVMDQTSYTYLIFVQDDCSTDKTLSIAKKSADFVDTNKQRQGLAITFQNEMDHCLALQGDIIVHTDGDGQYLPQYIPPLIEKVEQGYNFVIGSRFLDGINYGNSPLKAIGNILFSALISLISGKKTTDVTSGLRAMDRKTAISIKIRSKFTYTYDQYLQAVEKKLKIFEIPVKGRKTRKSRLMKNVFDYTWKAFWDILINFRQSKNKKGP